MACKFCISGLNLPPPTCPLCPNFCFRLPLVNNREFKAFYDEINENSQSIYFAIINDTDQSTDDYDYDGVYGDNPNDMDYDTDDILAGEGKKGLKNMF